MSESHMDVNEEHTNIHLSHDHLSHGAQMSYIFLASPYSHPQASTREDRYREALSALSWLLNKELWAYSPIVHCHALAQEHRLPYHADYWSSYNRLMLLTSRALMVLTMPGWRESVGVQDEIDYAAKLNKPIHYLRRTQPNSPFYYISKTPNAELELQT